MPVYSFFVYDKHCECVYFANFAPKGPRPGPSTLPHVYRPALSSAGPAGRRDSVATSASASASASVSDRASLPPWERTSAAGAGLGLLGGDALDNALAKDGGGGGVGGEYRPGLAFDEEAKLVYGIIFSLRNMVKKLSGREDDSFHSFSTSAYKLHYLYTATAYHFVLVTSPMSESLRFILRQIYTGPFSDHVVRNPMVGINSADSGKGIDNDAFRLAVEKLLAAI